MYSLKKLLPYAMATSLLLSGCSEKVDCEIPSRHIHKYTKKITNNITITLYLDNEVVNYFGFNRKNDYLEITRDDENFFKTIEHLLNGENNWDYFYYLMSNNHDYLMFYYYYTTTEIYTTTDSDGETHTHLRTVSHSGWTDDPNYYHNTGEVRLYHHKYYGYKVICYKKKYYLERSPLVDDIREIIKDYPYIKENPTEEVYKTFYYSENSLPFLNANQFNTFNQPDLTNTSINLSKIK